MAFSMELRWFSFSSFNSANIFLSQPFLLFLLLSQAKNSLMANRKIMATAPNCKISFGIMVFHLTIMFEYDNKITMKKVLSFIFAAIFFGFLIWVIWNAVFGYADWMNSSRYPEGYDVYQVSPNYPHH